MSERMPKGRVLVVDDDPVVRAVAVGALEPLGLRIEELGDAESALEAFDREPANLVLLDVEMPGMNGFEACEELRRRAGATSVAILIATGHTDPNTIERAFQVGASDFVKKPLDWQLLQHRVRFLMRAHEAFSELEATLADLRGSRASLANAQRQAQIGSWEWHVEEQQLLCSEELLRLTGLGAASTLDRLLEVVHPEDLPELKKALQSALEEALPWTVDHRMSSPEGEELFVHNRGQAIPGPTGQTERLSGTIQDVSDRRRAEQQVQYMAHYDRLTGLPNRLLLTEHIERLIHSAGPKAPSIGVLLLDLDRFARVNETLGHDVGDLLLCAVAERLQTCIRASDWLIRVEPDADLSLSRLGGDEFTVLLRALREPGDARIVAQRLLEVLREPFQVGDHHLVMSGSVGIALFDRDGADAEALLRSAGSALQHAKRDGRDTFHFFDASMSERAVRSMALEASLRSALESEEELQLVFQPMMDAETREICAVEVLSRWESPEHGPVSPFEFIAVAEETGLIYDLGEKVLRGACHQLRAWDDAGLPPVRISVNVSSRQLERPDLVDTVRAALEAAELPAQRLELEITETALFSEGTVVTETLQELHKLGVGIALDDFGTGYSSLSHLIRFPIDVLKIDRAFVSGISDPRNSRAIAASVIAMAHRLGLTVVAEGIENEEEASLLRDEACDLLQGYWLCRPVPADELAAVLSAQND
ncbi:MAG: two-component system response regulator [Myxococcota bacterium]